MADLIQTLLPPFKSSQASALHHSSSNESFHSTTSHTDAVTNALPQAQKSQVHDLHAYLNDPANLASSGSQRTMTSSAYRQEVPNLTSSAAEPVPIGTNTFHNVSSLNQLCQAKGLPTPKYQLDQAGEGNEVEFYGSVYIGETALSSNRRWKNKKSAREGLSEEALPHVREMAQERQKKGLPSGETATNWIGLLLEYHQVGVASPTYTYFARGSQFSAECKIPEYLDRDFGSRNESFPSKKSAQTAAARDAVKFLIQEGRLDADGRPRQKKRTISGSTPGQPSNTTHRPLRTLIEDGNNILEVPKSPYSLAQCVSELSGLLGLQAPQYHLRPSSDLAPNILNGYATFQNASNLGIEGVGGAVGEVRNVYGKKNAKEEVARKVWEVLKDAARSRSFEVREL